MTTDMPGLKTGAKNDIIWSEIGSGFGEPGGTPPPRIPRSPPPGGKLRFSKEQTPIHSNTDDILKLPWSSDNVMDNRMITSKGNLKFSVVSKSCSLRKQPTCQVVH